MPAAENDTKRKCWKRQKNPRLKLNKLQILANRADGKQAELVYCPGV